MTRPIRIIINGFGRIGRTVTRQLLKGSANADIDIVGINDIAPLETCAYLFRYDSVYGPYPGVVSVERNQLVIEGRAIGFSTYPDLRSMDLTGVDVVLECTGRATSRAVAEAGLEAGASSVLISGPSPAADVTVVLGANEGDVGDARIVSNASCTTNAVAPLLRRIDTGLGIEHAHVTTIHCYTGSQPTVDLPGPNLERSRAAAVSMVPTTTSAADQIVEVLPGFRDKLSVAAVRVPTLSVSAIDAVLQVSGTPDPFLEAFWQEISLGSQLIGLTVDPCVSSDLRARPESLILAKPETMIVGQNQLRMFGWYDNEWGFSARMVDMTRRLARRDPSTDTATS